MPNLFQKSKLYGNSSSLYKRSFYEEKIDLISLYEQYTGWALRKSGRAYVGVCPFHEDNSPSFAIYTDTNSVYCFSCKFSARGNWFEKRLKEL